MAINMSLLTELFAASPPVLKVARGRSADILVRWGRPQINEPTGMSALPSALEQGRPEFSTGSASLLAPGGFCSRLCPGRTAAGDRAAAGSAPLPSGSRVELGGGRNGTRCCCSCWSGCCCCGSPPGRRTRGRTNRRPETHGPSPKQDHVGQSASRSNMSHTNPSTTPTHSQPCHIIHNRSPQNTPPDSCRENCQWQRSDGNPA